MPNHSRGSQWRKWDLHLHTPLSLEQQFGGDSPDAWDKYVEKIASLPEEVKVIGVTDYLFVDGYEKLIARKAEMPNIEMFLPNIEFRLDTFSGTVDNKKRHNFHIIFDPDVKVSTIKDQLLNCLSKGYTISDKSEWLQTPTRTSLEELGKKIKEKAPAGNSIHNKTDLHVGFDNITYRLSDIEELLKKDCFKGKFVSAIGYSEWDQSRWDQSAVQKRDLINKADFCLTSLQDSDKIAENIASLKSEDLQHRVLHSSDAHKLEDVGNSQLWLKSDTTFEGLMQALYDYEERVRIQTTNPYDDVTKYVLDSIQFVDDGTLKAQVIPFNRDLVSIIGSKGSGKSLLLSAIASVSDLANYDDQRHPIFENNEHTQVINLDLYDKDAVKKEKHDIELSSSDDDWYTEPILYIKQEELADRSKRPFTVRKAYLKELGIEDLSIGYQDIIDDTEYILEQIGTLSADLVKITQAVGLNDISKLEEYLTKKIASLEETNKKLSNDKTRKVIEELSQIIADGQEVTIWSKDDGFKDISLLAEDINERIIAFNEKASTYGAKPDNLIPIVDTGKLEASHKKTSEDLSKIIAKRREEYTAKKKELEALGVSEDIPTLLKTIESIQREIATHKKSLDDATKIIKTIPEKQKYLSELYAPDKIITTRIQERVVYIDDKFSRFKADREGSQIFKQLFSSLDIKANVFFDYKQLEQDIAECFYKGKISTKVIHDTIFGGTEPTYARYFEWVQTSFWSYLETHKPDLMVSIPRLNISGIERLKQIVLLDWYEYVSVSVEITHKFGVVEKEIKTMSTGELATVLLKLILVTQGLDKQIILLDQPEDHLDNDFIANDLVELIKTLKKMRQIIMVTHNANLVVMTDSEQVIVAKGLDEEYLSGGIENPVIKENIINILEGGPEALRKRFNRYGNA